jgi:hypothetical protein
MVGITFPSVLKPKMQVLTEASIHGSNMASMRAPSTPGVEFSKVHFQMVLFLQLKSFKTDTTRKSQRKEPNA